MYILSGEYVKSMVFKFIWALYKIFFLTQLISLNLLASRRDPNLCPARGSVLAWLVLATVPDSCWRGTVAPEPILPVSLDPQMSPPLVPCHHGLGVDWKLSEMGQNCLVVFSHVT